MSGSDSENSKRIQIGDRVVVTARGASGNYTAEFSDHGVHRRRSLRTRNFKIAKQRALQLEAKLASGDFQAPPPSLSISQAVEEFIAAKKTEKRSPKTIVKYRTELQTFATYAATHGILNLQLISARLVDQYRAARQEGRSAKTCYTENIILKGFVKFCLSRDLIVKDPLRFVRLNKPTNLPKIAPRLQQIYAILNHATPTRRLQLAMLAFTGMRAGELQMLRTEDVDLEAGWIHVVARADWVPKNRQSRKIPIHPRLKPLLASLPTTKRTFFFCAEPSKKFPGGDHFINTKHLNDYLKGVANRQNLTTGRKNDGLVVHSLRHFFETFCVNANIPQRAVDTWMGHTGDKGMGSVYYRLNDEDSQDFMKRVPF